MSIEEDPIQPLSPALTRHRDEALARASEMAGGGRLDAAKLQALYDACLRDGTGDHAMATAIGAGLGQLIVERGGFEWVRVADQFGDELGVAEPRRTLFCVPSHMIGLRFERGDKVNLDKLCNETIATIRENAKKAGR